MLYVTMSPKDSLPPQQFHDWYNNEHGPLRLRLPFVTNGFRYRAKDLDSEKGSPEKPEWMAIYDLTDMNELTKEAYLRLRGPEAQSARERATMAQISVDRKFYDLISSKEGKDFKTLETMGLPREYVEGSSMYAVFMKLTDVPGADAEFNKWYEEEHIPLLLKVPGLRRARRFKTSSLESPSQIEYVALYDLAPENGLGTSEEFKAAISTKWRDEIQAKYVKSMVRRVYELYYTFGPAPRDLAPLEDSTGMIEPFTSNDKMTKTLTSPRKAIESYVTTKDGLIIPYRLEGSSDADAPLLIFSNSILATWSIWDRFLSQFLSTPTGSKYRILRYNSRGRSRTPSTKVDWNLLSSDVIEILDALRVQRAATLIGVSFGGCTALNTALKYPSRINSFIGCDFPPTGSGSAVWEERFALVDSDPSTTSLPNGDKDAGEKVAEQTVRRWFVKESFEDAELAKEIQKTKEGVRSNSFQGLKSAVPALYEYDLKAKVNETKTKPKGMFIVGGSDGPLPGAMKPMAEEYGNGAECVVIEGTGHLPMVEKPKEFCDAVERFLASV
jgi:pimeloyl-ACP methyl ester carboxylesterase